MCLGVFNGFSIRKLNHARGYNVNLTHFFLNNDKGILQARERLIILT